MFKAYNVVTREIYLQNVDYVTKPSIIMQKSNMFSSERIQAKLPSRFSLHSFIVGNLQDIS